MGGRIFRKTAFLIDFGGKRKHSTPIKLAKEWVNVLQSCYPGKSSCFLLESPHLNNTLITQASPDTRATGRGHHCQRPLGTVHVPLPRPALSRPHH